MRTAQPVLRRTSSPCLTHTPPLLLPLAGALPAGRNEVPRRSQGGWLAGWLGFAGCLWPAGHLLVVGRAVSQELDCIGRSGSLRHAPPPPGIWWWVGGAPNAPHRPQHLPGGRQRGASSLAHGHGLCLRRWWRITGEQPGLVLSLLHGAAGRGVMPTRRVERGTQSGSAATFLDMCWGADPGRGLGRHVAVQMA